MNMKMKDERYLCNVVIYNNDFSGADFTNVDITKGIIEVVFNHELDCALKTELSTAYANAFATACNATFTDINLSADDKAVKDISTNLYDFLAWDRIYNYFGDEIAISRETFMDNIVAPFIGTRGKGDLEYDEKQNAVLIKHFRR